MPVDLPGLVPRGFARPEALYRPAHVVLVADPAQPAAPVLARNLAAGGFRGTLSAVGLNAEGFRVADDISALDAAPDLAVLAVPEPAVEAAMMALGARSCRAAVVTGAAADLAGIAARSGVPALGQGSFGVAVPRIGLNATVAHIAPRAGTLALVTQSASLARAVLDWAEAAGIGFSHVIGIGGNAGLGFAHALDWLARDPGTAAILLDIRRIRDCRQFVSAARAAARSRPVVAIRAGGRAEDASGVGDAVMEAALRRAGVLRVGGFADLLAAAETLARARLPPRAEGDRIAIVANGTGLARITADAVLRGAARVAREVALDPRAGPALAEQAASLAALPEVDQVIALHAPVDGEDTASLLARFGGSAKAPGLAPILIGWLGEATAAPQRASLERAGLAVFATPEAAVRGALHLAEDRRNRRAAAELPSRDVLQLAPDRAAVAAMLARVRGEARLALTEDEALALLAAYGLAAVETRVAPGVAHAVAAAGALGFPVVLKLRSADIADKSSVGGVALGLRSGAALRDAATAMTAAARRQRPDARLDGFLVQRQAPRGVELRLRLGDDPMFGPFIGFGLGGTAAAVLGDEAFDLPPLNEALARGLIARSRAAVLLGGYRDHPAADLQAVAGALVRLSQIAIDFPEIATLVINPLVARADGVLALDAGCTLRPAGEAARLAVPPYPAEWVSRWTGRGGATLTIRPIRPEDAEALGIAFKRLSPEDVRWRFFSVLKELPPQQIARLTQIDYDREMAFVATRPGEDGGEDLLGVARLIREGAAPRGEFAIVVGLKGAGLGRHLMERLFDWARATGIGEIVGQVLVDNAPMLAFVKALGFTVQRSAEDEEVMEVRRGV